jgi:hypothetical protein
MTYAKWLASKQVIGSVELELGILEGNSHLLTRLLICNDDTNLSKIAFENALGHSIANGPGATGDQHNLAANVILFSFTRIHTYA